MFQMRYPDGYLWSWPGFYSITVPYGATNDFFFSGHIGCCLIMALEYRANKWYKFMGFSFFTLTLQTFLMACLRGHYVIDMIAGLIFGHYFWVLGERFSYYMDV